MPNAPSQPVREALERVVSSPGFADAGRLGPFLRFVVERALAGEPVKEAVIGVEVFSRSADYDPRIDPIVRVEARRLRSRLAEYYAGPGASDPVVIDLPKGTYVPVFTERTPSGAPASPLRSWRKWGIVGATVAVSLVALIAVLARRQSRPETPVVAVLPFANLSDDRSNEYFSDGLTEELTDRLARVPGLKVVARSSAFQFKGKAEDLREVGRRLSATAVVEGSVRRAGDRLRVTAQIIDVESGTHLWSETYERTLRDVFAIQDEIARAIANSLRAELRVGFAAQAPPPTSNVEAYQLYLRARHHLNHAAMAGLELAASDLQQAIALDPKFAAAQGLLAADYCLLGYYKLRPAGEVWPLAKAAAGRAISLDPQQAPGHAALGMALGMHDWNWREAELSLRRAVALDPRSSEAHVALAVGYLLPTGHIEDAVRELRRGLELDPQSYLASIGTAFALLASGKPNEAIPEYRHATELNPSHVDAQWDLAMAYALAGQKDAARKQFDLVSTIRHGKPGDLGATEYGLLGDLEIARKHLVNPNGRPIFVAYAYGVLGDAAKAAEWLEKARMERDPQLIWIKVDPRLAKVRQDPRVASIIQRIGLATP